MKPYAASLLNSILLIALGTWGYLSSDTPSVTALVPVAFGVVLLLMVPGVKRENRTVAHVAVVFTLLVLLGLFMPLRGALARGDTMALARVSVMILSTVFAMVVFVRSFVEARRKRMAE